MTKLLFILKKREDYNAITHSHIGMSTGLYNSASFVKDMLNEYGVESKLVVVHDNNDIDREVTKYRPTHVIIEALWVVPTKFPILEKLHPTVQWIIRLHSEMPFMAGEGMAMDWLGDYSLCKNVTVACNAPRMFVEVKDYLRIKNDWTEDEASERVIYLPNYYPNVYEPKRFDKSKPHLDIGCFGAIRPLKNHLVQAHAAIKFAESIGKKLHFHVNSGRIEMKGEPVVNNLRALFAQLYHKGHRLHNHQWTPREDFLGLCASMDIGMQCTFSETFNIVGADFISQGVPIITSSEIPWYTKIFVSDPTSSSDIIRNLCKTYRFPNMNVLLHQHNLSKYINKTVAIWCDYFKEK
jgi:hypothetical protein